MVKPGRNVGRCAWLLTALAAVAVCPACNWPPVNRIVVEDHRSRREGPREHFEDFVNGYYRVNGDGLVDIVLHKPGPPEKSPIEAVDQLVHIRVYWKALPGRTHSESSMLNCRVSYCLLRGNDGISYDGGGFLRYRINESKGTLAGTLEGADLQPLRRGAGDLEIFERATISGRIQARCDPRRVARLIGRVERRLGALPAIEPDRSPPAL